ncbi:hypothetical protein [Nioella nitratireducens]|uniref:hypothetical protein n=1 Tax=Nioella nitratireducens TaxID=1287720 RepID=UPI0011BA8FFD|nr:hypothetical protein [Nioella nitratireducens]
MRDTDQYQTDVDLQVMLRAEILELRSQLARRDAEIAALLQQSDAQAVQDIAEKELSGSLKGWLRPRLQRFRHRLVLRRQVAALSASPLFDADWYAGHYPECGGPEKAAVHYLLKGAFAGHDPGPNFDTAAYYRANPDVAAAGWPALAHFVLHGETEDRRVRLISGG